ncbi:MAG: ABC transporter permease [Thermoanaerobaculia bacterium]
MRHLLTLTWLEIKIFLREPMGAIGTVLVPVILFIVLAGVGGDDDPSMFSGGGDLPVLITMFIALGGVTSLTAIISIYREGGILKRLRATPLRPLSILGAHVAAKMLFTVATLVLLAAAGRRFYTGSPPASLLGFLVAVALVTLSVLSVGFVFASVISTARFAQPLASMLLYPLLGVSGLFFPLEILPGAWHTAARLSPLAHAVDLLRGTWSGLPWSDHWIAVAVLFGNFLLCSAVASKVFKWE